MPASFGRLPDGTDVGLFTLSNARGLEVRAIAYGAILVSIRAPDRRGQLDDVVLGCDDLEGYLTRSRYFGAVVGRYGNRIANGRFTLDGRTFQLATNNGRNHLHGGIKGFDKVVWHAQPHARDGHTAVAFSYTSPDGEEAYPGTLQARVSYTLTERSELVIEYEATTDKPTPVNLTQHSYFNLAGEGRGDILQHELSLDADRFTPVDDTMIPTGEMAPVAGTPFDFRQPAAIGARIGADHEQLRRGRGLRPQLRAAAAGHGSRPAAGSCGAGRRAGDRTHARCGDDGAGRAVLRRQPPGRPDRERRPRVRSTHRFLPGDAALPRLAEPSSFPVDDPAARRDLPIEDGVHVWRGTVTPRILV